MASGGTNDYLTISDSDADVSNTDYSDGKAMTGAVTNMWNTDPTREGRL